MFPNLLAGHSVKAPDAILLLAIAHRIGATLADRYRAEAGAHVCAPLHLRPFRRPMGTDRLSGNSIARRPTPLRPIARPGRSHGTAGNDECRRSHLPNQSQWRPSHD